MPFTCRDRGTARSKAKRLKLVPTCRDKGTRNHIRCQQTKDSCILGRPAWYHTHQALVEVAEACILVVEEAGKEEE
jgi:hypothetical protein